VFELLPNGTKIVIAGTGTAGFSGDTQQATAVQLHTPVGIGLDSKGNVYIADTNNNRIRKVTTDGIINTIAVSGTTPGFAGDGAAATAATQFISTIAGGGTTGLGNGGVAAKAALSYPQGLAMDSIASLYIGDTVHSLLRTVTATAAPLSFASTVVGSQSSDSPLSVQLSNIGNTDLTFAAPSSGNNPSFAPGFQYDPSSTCPNLNISSPVATLASGTTCTYAVDFIPVAAGTDNASFAISDNNLGAAAANQSVVLIGTGIAPVTQLAFATAPQLTLTAGSNTGTVVVDEEKADGSLSTQASDLITLTVTGAGSYTHTYTATAVNGIATFNLAGVALTKAGGYTYTASIVASPSITAAIAGETVTATSAFSIIGTGSATSTQSAVIGTSYAYPFSVAVSSADLLTGVENGANRKVHAIFSQKTALHSGAFGVSHQNDRSNTKKQYRALHLGAQLVELVKVNASRMSLSHLVDGTTGCNPVLLHGRDNDELGVGCAGQHDNEQGHGGNQHTGAGHAPRRTECQSKQRDHACR
jgi:hypothetical protein